MTQTSLFDHPREPETLPAQGHTMDAIVAGTTAAVHAAARRAPLIEAYKALLLRAGAHGATDHEAAAALSRPLSSICSTRSSGQVKPHITEHGHRRGPYGEINTVYVLRVAIGRRFDADASTRPQEEPYAVD